MKAPPCEAQMALMQSMYIFQHVLGGSGPGGSCPGWRLFYRWRLS